MPLLNFLFSFDLSIDLKFDFPSPNIIALAIAVFSVGVLTFFEADVSNDLFHDMKGCFKQIAIKHLVEVEMEEEDEEEEKYMDFFIRMQYECDSPPVSAASGDKNDTTYDDNNCSKDENVLDGKMKTYICNKSILEMCQRIHHVYYLCSADRYLQKN